MIKWLPEVNLGGTEYKLMKKSLLFILFIILLILWQIFVVTPYMGANYFFSEASSPEKSAIPLFILIAIVPYISFILSLIISKGVNYFRCIVYPLSALILYFGFFICLTVVGGTVLWLLVFTLLPFLFVVLVIFIISLIYDIKSK